MKLVKYCKTEVWRDEEWWEKNVYKFMDVWKKIEHYKENGYESLIPEKKEYIKGRHVYDRIRYRIN